jgi:hypothetical protein
VAPLSRAVKQKARGARHRHRGGALLSRLEGVTLNLCFSEVALGSSPRYPDRAAVDVVSLAANQDEQAIAGSRSPL